MKVYFEPCGCTIKKQPHDITRIKVYVNPEREDSTSHAYMFNSLGEKFSFAWADPYKALCVDLDLLPKVMWQSIKHGADDFHIIDPNHDVYFGRRGFTLEDLKYTPVNMKEIKAYKEVCKKIDSVSTIDEFKELYPLIKKGNRTSTSIIYKLLSLMNINPAHYRNGEIGMEFVHNWRIYDACLKEIGLE